jgi:hypothetical protein
MMEALRFVQCVNLVRKRIAAWTVVRNCFNSLNALAGSSEEAGVDFNPIAGGEESLLHP